MDFGMMAALKKAYCTAANPSHIRALVITNPHNPFGQCYPPEVLREFHRFCQAHNLHLISDEVYALSTFESPSALPPFVSALSLLQDVPENDVEGRCFGERSPDLARIHVVWSMSKDFGSSGIRMVRQLAFSVQAKTNIDLYAPYRAASSPRQTKCYLQV